MRKLELVDVWRSVTKEKREEYSEEDTLFEFYNSEDGIIYIFTEIEK